MDLVKILIALFICINLVHLDTIIDEEWMCIYISENNNYNNNNKGVSNAFLHDVSWDFEDDGWQRMMTWLMFWHCKTSGKVYSVKSERVADR